MRPSQYEKGSIVSHNRYVYYLEADGIDDTSGLLRWALEALIQCKSHHARIKVAPTKILGTHKQYLATNIKFIVTESRRFSSGCDTVGDVAGAARVSSPPLT